MTVEQKFNSHMIPANQRVRYATSEFIGYAIFWWNDLVKRGQDPYTWSKLKRSMRSRFISLSYKRDLKKKLQRFDQGNRSVHEYFNDLHVAMLRCDIDEEDDDTMTCFYSGLCKDIQNIVAYKDYNTTDQLFHIAVLAEQELQDRAQSSRNTFGVSSSSRLQSSKGRAAPPDTRRTLPPPATPSTPEVSKSAFVPKTGKTDTISATTPTTSANIVCHRCKGMGHVMRECPSKRAYIATDNGGYISTSEAEEDVQASEEESAAFGGDDAEDYTHNGTYVVQHVLSTQVEHEDKLQRHNLF